MTRRELRRWIKTALLAIGVGAASTGALASCAVESENTETGSSHSAAVDCSRCGSDWRCAERCLEEAQYNDEPAIANASYSPDDVDLGGSEEPEDGHDAYDDGGWEI